MTHIAAPRRRFAFRRLPLPLAFAALTVGALVWRWPQIAGSLSAAERLHGPDLALFAEQSAAIEAHILFAFMAIGVGGYLMASRKGARLHRIAGWTWSCLMIGLAGTSFFITELGRGSWSWVHLVSGWLLVVLPIALFAARRHRVDLHRRAMQTLFYGTLLGAGILTLLPGRVMWRLFFG